VSCDAVFEETRPWEWSTEDQGVVMGDVDPFTVEHVVVRVASGLAPVVPRSLASDAQLPTGDA
jgi:hypothetical protein